MAKLMLMQELNVTAKYGGKKLEDIQLPEVVFAADDAIDNPLKVELSNDEVVPAVLMGQVNEDIEEDSQPYLLKDDTYDEYNFEEDEDDDDYDQGNQRKQRNKGPSTRLKRTTNEVEELHIFFKEQIASRQTPGRQEVETALKKSKTNNGVLHRRQWET